MDKVYLYHPINEPQPHDQYSDYIMSFNTWHSIPDASKKEIFCSGMYYDEKELVSIVSKLRHKGIITLVGTDLLEISRKVVTGLLTPSDLRKLINNEEKLYTCFEMIELFKKSSLNVIMKRIDDYKFTIKAQRP